MKLLGFALACGVSMVMTAGRAEASPITMGCDGVDVAAPSGGAVVNTFSYGAINCVVLPNATLGLGGGVTAAADLGAPRNVTNYSYNNLGDLIADTSTQGP